MRLHQKPIPRSLALVCCSLNRSPCIRLPSVFCCWLPMHDCTVCTWFEFALIFLLCLLLLSCYLSFVRLFSTSVLSVAPSFLPLSVISCVRPISQKSIFTFSSQSSLRHSPLYIFFPLLLLESDIPPCTTGNTQLSLTSLKGQMKLIKLSLRHLHQFISQSYENQAVADTLDSICSSRRLASRFVVSYCSADGR